MLSRLTNWFQEKRRWIVFGLFLFLIITLSFGLGYLVAKEANPAPIIIEKN
jgi:hypothetical protein